MTEITQTTTERTSAGWAVRIFALASYSFFLLTFVYFFFYLAGGVVPVHIDNIRPSNMLEALLVNGALILLFAVQHTIMAGERYKDWFASRFNPAWQRPVFVFVSTVFYLFMMWQWRGNEFVIWQMDSNWAILAMWGLYGLGWATMLLSTYLIDHWHLFGLKQAFTGKNGFECGKGFVTPLLYKLVRHPMMTGVIIFVWATPYMTFGHMLMAAGFTLYILAGVRFEEEKLVAELGEEYEQYQKSTPALIPRP